MLPDGSRYMEKVPGSSGDTGAMFRAEFVSVVQEIADVLAAEAQAALFGRTQGVPCGARVRRAQPTQVVPNFQAQDRVPKKIGHFPSHPLGDRLGKFIVGMKPC